MTRTLTTTDQNKQLISGIYDAVRNGDVEAFLSSCAEDINLVEAESLIVGGRYEGRDAVLGCIAQLTEHYDWPTLDVPLIVADGDSVVAQVNVMSAGPERMEIKILEWWRVRDGKAVEVRPYYLDTEVMNRVLAKNAASRAQG